MRALLDECTPRSLKRELRGLAVSSVHDFGWRGKRNGELLRVMRRDGFGVLVTVDQNLPYQQNLVVAGIAVSVLAGGGIRIEDIRPLVPALREALRMIRPGEVIRLTLPGGS